MIAVLTLAIYLLLSVSVFAQPLAFPTAMGWGRFATGGRGGTVIKVTNLNPTGPGSFHACATASGPRTCIFDVAGTIDMNPPDGIGCSNFDINNGELTVAAQTAPGDGILLRGGCFSANADDIIVRHLRSRPGFEGIYPTANGQGSSFRAITILGSSSNKAERIIFDHCSASWAPDDTIGISHGRDVTFQWCIIAEGLKIEGQYGRAMLVDGVTANLSLLKNYWVHHQRRAPYIQVGDYQAINNLYYNIRKFAEISDANGATRSEVIANYHRTGPDSDLAISTPTGWKLYAASRAGTSAYFLDNYHNLLRPDNTFSQYAHVSNEGTPTSPTPFGFPSLGSNLTTAVQARTDVLANAGARVPKLDAVDVRVLEDILQLDGAINLTSVTFPTIEESSRDTGYDTDNDGIPDAWETLCNGEIGTLNPNDGTDSNDIISGVHADVNGYSKLEVFINELAGDYPLNSCGNQLSGDTTDPTNVDVVSPTNASTVSGASVNICATADDETGLSRVEFFVDDMAVGTDTTETSDEFCVTWDSTTVADGSREISAIAYDTSENPTPSSTITVNVDNISAYTAIHTASAPTINGNLSEFASANLIEFNSIGGNETDCKMMYDSTNLYIGCTTTDTNLTGSTTANDDSAIFGEDSLEIVLDPDNSNGAWTSSDYKLAINIQNARYDVHTQSNTSWSYGGSTSVARSGDIDGVADDTSWTVEAAIPWSSMSVTPSTSATYAINLQVNDKDGTASTVRYRWNGTSSNNLSDAMDIVLGEPAGGDTTDPVVSITQPSDGATIGGTYRIRADAQDDSGILDVQFYRDTSTAICSADTVSPFECEFDTTGISEGSHTFHAVARDNVSPTPNDATSATVTVTVDNTPTSAPSDLSTVPSYDGIGYVIFLNWVDVTDAASYQIERCDGASCSDFEVVSTELSSDYLDEFLSRKTEYCYRVRAFDIASNPSSYSSTVCDLTLDAILLDEPTTLSTTHNSAVTMLDSPETLSTNHSGAVTVLGAPDTLSTNNSGTPVFLGQPSNLGTL